MSSKDVEALLSGIAAAVAEPSRTRMLCALMDGRARTATELALVADVAPSTGSAHLARLLAAGLVCDSKQGKHKYFRLAGVEVAEALEQWMVLAARPAVRPFVPSTPAPLRFARTCYDHLAGTLGVLLHDSLVRKAWVTARSDAQADAHDYVLTEPGLAGLRALGLDAGALRCRGRRLACACMDWSERRPHLGGALGAALLASLLSRGWLLGALDSRRLELTADGRRGLVRALDLPLDAVSAGAAAAGGVAEVAAVAGVTGCAAVRPKPPPVGR